MAPGAYIYVADAALVTEDNLAALGDTLFIRLPAPYSECGLITEAVAHNTWEEVGVLARTKPTKHRPGTAYKVSEGEVALYGTAYRAVSDPLQHAGQRQHRLERDIQASYSTAQTAARRAEQQEYFCRADAETAAAQLRAVPTAYHRMEVTVEERPVYGRGRPSAHKPRPITAMRYRLKTVISPQTRHLCPSGGRGRLLRARNVPTAGELAHSARDLLTVYKDQHGTEQNYGFLKDPVLVNSLFLKKPERIEALGLILLLALLLLALDGARYADVCGHHPHALARVGQKSDGAADAFMMITKFAGVIVLSAATIGSSRARSPVVQQHYLTALDVPATCFTLPAGLTEGSDGSTAPLTTAKTDPPMVSCGPPAHPRHDRVAIEIWCVPCRETRATSI